LWFWRSVCNTGPLIKSALFHETIDFPRKKIYLAAKNVQKNRTTKKSWTKMHFSPSFIQSMDHVEALHLLGVEHSQFFLTWGVRPTLFHAGIMHVCK
jgi:hypothetical protein